MGLCSQGWKMCAKNAIYTIHLEARYANSADVEVLHMKTTQVFFSRTLPHSLAHFFNHCHHLRFHVFRASTFASEVSLWTLTRHGDALHCPLSGFVSDQIFAAPEFSGLHRKKLQLVQGQLWHISLYHATWVCLPGELVWVLLMEQKVLRKVQSRLCI